MRWRLSKMVARLLPLIDSFNVITSQLAANLELRQIKLAVLVPGLRLQDGHQRHR